MAPLYDIVVIGAGAAGLSASHLARSLGSRVALVSQGAPGGECLNTGCVPSKAFIHSVREWYRQSPHAPAARYPAPEEAFLQALAHAQTAIQRIAPNDSFARYTSMGVDCYAGKARFLDRYRIFVTGPNNSTILRGRYFIVATGSSPRTDLIKCQADIKVLTSETVWSVSSLPDSLVIVGGGPFGCEMAQPLARLGCRVSLIEEESRLLPREDQDVSQRMQSLLEREGVQVLTGTRAFTAFAPQDGGVNIACASLGKQISLRADNMLLASGGRPNTGSLDLSAAMVSTSADGFILNDENGRTTARNIFACGDVVGAAGLTNIASTQATRAVLVALMGPIGGALSGRNAPARAIFTDPEFAMVGATEGNTQESSKRIEVTEIALQHIDRAVIDDIPDGGFVKVLTDARSGKLMGAAIFAPNASELVAPYAVAIDHGIRLRSFLTSGAVYPSYGLSAKYLAAAWAARRASRYLRRGMKLHIAWQRLLHGLRFLVQ